MESWFCQVNSSKNVGSQFKEFALLLNIAMHITFGEPFNCRSVYDFQCGFYFPCIIACLMVILDMQSKVKSLGTGQTTAQQQKGVDAYLAAPTSGKKQKLQNGHVGDSGEKKKKRKEVE